MTPITKRWLLSRRTMLKGLGACIGLPVLEAMYSRDAYADARLPVRMAALYMPNGVHPTQWTPQGQAPDAMDAAGPGRELPAQRNFEAARKSKRRRQRDDGALE
jgi:hypothetical protein